MAKTVKNDLVSAEHNANGKSPIGQKMDSDEPVTKKFGSDDDYELTVANCAPSTSDSSVSGNGNNEEEEEEKTTSKRSDGFNDMARSELIQRGCQQANCRSPSDFYFMQLIGEGAISYIFRCREVNTSNDYAIKVLEKSEILKYGKFNYVSREKKVMAYLTYLCRGHPFLVSLYCTFQDQERLYFAMTIAERGDLYRLLKNVHRLPSAAAKFYASEIVSGLTFMHRHGIVHRDIKPENILISNSGHILISDFETAKAFGSFGAQAAINDCGSEIESDVSLIDEARSKHNQRSDRSSFVGTAQYISPEVVQGLSIGPECDYWALGAILCQMLSGKPPFYGENEFKTMEQIVKGQFTIPSNFSDIEKSIISEFLVVEQTERLGSLERGSYKTVMEHPYFEDVDFENLLQQDPPRFGSEPCLTWETNEMSMMTQRNGLDKEQMKNLIIDCFDGGIPMEAYQADSDNDENGDGVQEVALVEEPIAPPQQMQQQSNPASVNTDEMFIVNLQNFDLRLKEQAEKNEFHRFVKNELILKSGRLDKRRGLFARRREFLLTTGPYLFYVDPFEMVYKGNIPITPETTVEIKNFKTFSVKVPGRDYYLSDPLRCSTEWRAAIYAVRDFYYPPKSNSPRS